MSRLMHLTTNDLDVFMARKRNGNIFREGDASGPIYQVETGCVRLVKLSDSGQRCIIRFCYPGDLFGLGSYSPAEIDAEAASDTKVSKMTASRLATIMQGEPNRALCVIDAAHGGQTSHNEHFLVLSYGHADEKIAWFLNASVRRASNLGSTRLGAGLVIELPMPRGDIADYLGMKLETVSRELAKLKDIGIIETVGFRKIIVLKPRELALRAALDSHETRKAEQQNNVRDWMPNVANQRHLGHITSDHGQARMAISH